MSLSLLEKENIGVVIPFYFLSHDLNKDILSLKNTISILKNYANKIVVVDDGVGIPNIKNIKLIRHQTNKGKSSAIRRGLKEILKDYKIKVIIECDADDDQNPSDIKYFIETFNSISLQTPCLLIGDRYTAPQMKKTNKYRLSVNKLQEVLFKKLGIRLRDSVSGFRGYNRYFAEEFVTPSVH